jgi:hypothetical protein
MAEKKKDKKWIQGMEMKEGAFTAKAKKKGITTAQLQRTFWLIQKNMMRKQ